MMLTLGLKSHYRTHQISSIQKPQPILLKPSSQFLPAQSRSCLSHSQLKSRRRDPSGSRFNASSESNANGGGGGGEEDDVPIGNLRWSEMVLVADRDNAVAVGLTGALAWAGVQVMWQLFVVTMAIMMAAVKYTVVGVLLICILITLL